MSVSNLLYSDGLRAFTSFHVHCFLLSLGCSDDLVLEIGNHENTILSEESYNNFQNALSAQKYLEIKNRVPGTMVQKPKPLSASDRKAIQEANTQEKVDNKLNLVIESAMMSEEGSDIGIYNYLNSILIKEKLKLLRMLLRMVGCLWAKRQ